MAHGSWGKGSDSEDDLSQVFSLSHPSQSRLTGAYADLGASLPSTARLIFEKRRSLNTRDEEEIDIPSLTGLIGKDGDADSFGMDEEKLVKEESVNSDDRLMSEVNVVVEEEEETDEGRGSSRTPTPPTPKASTPTKRWQRSGIKISLTGPSRKESMDQDAQGKGNFWEQIAGRSNKVGDFPPMKRMPRFSRRSSDERNLHSAKQIRTMRKKVSVTSRGQKKTNQEDLAMAVVEGNMPQIEDIVEAYVTLYRGEGFRGIMRFRYDIDPRTLIITCVESPIADQEIFASPEGVTVDMFVGLSILHIACAFDQEQVITYLMKYGNNILNVTTPSGQTLMHTCAWFGTAAPLLVLIQNNCSLWNENARLHQPLHLAALRGHLMATKILIKSGADLEAQDEGGNTPLHAAILAGHYECAQELLNYDVDVNKVNNDNGTALHYTSKVPLVTLLMLHGANPNIVLDVPGSLASTSAIRSEKPSTAFNLFLESMPEGCNEILNNYLKTNGKSSGAYDLEMQFDYQVFFMECDLYPQGSEIGTLLNIVDVDRRDILKHPVCESFLHMKWLLVKHFFSCYLSFYIAFLMSLTVLVLLDFSPSAQFLDAEAKEIATTVCLIATVACMGIFLLKNIFLIFYNFRLYIRTFHNFNELALMACCAGFMLLYHTDVEHEATIHLAALSLFIAWFHFTLLLGKLPFGGIYINMIAGISKDLLTFLLLYTSTLVAFGLCFHILSHHLEQFKDPMSSILCILAMMVGEIGFLDTFVHSTIVHHWTTQVLFVLFLLFVSIIIMNLLVGLAISNITTQFQSAGVYRLKMTVLLIQMIEDVLGFARKACCLKVKSQLFPYLKCKRGALEDEPCNSPCIYVYPNQGPTVFVSDGYGKMVKTGFQMPKWILNNAFKIIRSESSAKDSQLASDKRKQEDRMNALSTELKAVKKDILAIKNDVQTIVSHIKGGGRTSSVLASARPRR